MQVKIAQDKYSIKLDTILPNKPGHLYTITFTDVSKNNVIASGSWDGTVRLHSETKETEVVYFFKEPVEGLKFSPNGKYLAVGIENTLHVYDMTTKKSFKAFPNETAVRGAVFAWSDDSTRLACIFYDNSIRVFDIASQKELGMIEDVPSLGGNNIAWKKDILAVGLNNGQIALYNLNSAVFQLAGTLEGHEDIVNAVAFSEIEDELKLYSVSPDKTLRSWNLSTSKGKIFYNNEDALLYLSVKQTISGQIILVSSESSNLIFIEELFQGFIPLQNSSYCNASINASADKFARGINDHDLGIFSIYDKKLITILEGKNDQVNAVKMLNNNQIIYGSNDKCLHLYNLQTKEEQFVFKGHSESVSSISLSYDRTSLVSSSYDDTVRLWDLVANREIRIISRNAELPSAVLYSEDGNTIYAASGGDFSIRGYSPAGKKLFSLESVHEEYVNKLVAYKNGFFSVSDDKKVVFWSNNKGKTFAKGDSEITAISISSNKEFLAFGSNKGTLNVLEIKNGQKKAEIKLSKKISCCTFSPDDKNIAIGSHTSLYIYDFESKENNVVCSLFEPVKEVFWYPSTDSTQQGLHSHLLIVSVSREVLSGNVFLTSALDESISKIDKMKIFTDTQQIQVKSPIVEDATVDQEAIPEPIPESKTPEPENEVPITPPGLEIEQPVQTSKPALEEEKQQSEPTAEQIDLLQKFQEEVESMVSSDKESKNIADFSTSLTKNMSSLELGSLVYKEYMETLKHLDKIQELIQINSEESHEGFKIILNRINRLKPVINEALEEIDFILD